MNYPATAAVRLLSGEREPVRVATTANITLYGLQTIDDIELAVNDRVLVKDQTDARENGIYTASTGRWYRAADASFSRAISEGVTVQVVSGTTHGGQAFRFSTPSPNIGADEIQIAFYLSADFTEVAQDAVDAGILQIEAARDDALDAIVAGTVLDGSVTPPKLDATQAEGFRQVLKDDTFVNLRTWYDVEGGFAAGDSDKIVAALAGAPFRSTLVTPMDQYKTSEALGITRQLNLKLHGSTIRADFAANDGASLFPIAIPVGTAGSGSTGGPEDFTPGVNAMVIDGGRLFLNGGGNAVIDLCPAGSPAGTASTFQTLIQNGTYSGWDRTIRFGSNYSPGPPATGNEVAFNTIFNCDLVTGGPDGVSVVEFDNTTDGNRLLFSKLAGKGTGVLANVALGAFNTMVTGTSIGSSDGAIRIANGSRMLFDALQIEQYGTNALNPKTHALVQGLGYISAACIWTRNNFGGGDEIRHNMVFYNARGHVIDYNQFNPGTYDPGETGDTSDIYFGDGGGGLVAKHNVVGPNNWARGTRPVLNAPTDANRRLKIKMDANARNNRGVWRPSSHITFLNGWSGANVEFMVDEWGIIHFEGDLVGGTTAANTQIMTMPLGCRPRKFISAPVVNTALGFTSLSIASDGAVYIATAGTAGIALGALSYAVVWLPAEEYDPGP